VKESAADFRLDLSQKLPFSAIDLLADQPNLLDSLRKAHMGNYQIVLSLLSSLDHGRELKRLVDHVIDICELNVGSEACKAAS
jgi:hypothetical protein